jgi:hypothetical protein
MLTTFDTDENLYNALRAGGQWFLLKVSSPEHLITAIRVVAAGEALLDPAVTARVISAFAGRPGPGPPAELADWPSAVTPDEQAGRGGQRHRRATGLARHSAGMPEAALTGYCLGAVARGPSARA